MHIHIVVIYWRPYFAGYIQEEDDINQLLCILQGNDDGMNVFDHMISVTMVSSYSQMMINSLVFSKL